MSARSHDQRSYDQSVAILARMLHAQVNDTFNSRVYIEGLAKASKALSRGEQHSVSKAAEISKAVLAASLRQLLDLAGDCPVLKSVSFDGTPIKVRNTTARLLDSGDTMKRSGYASHEFLVMLCFVRFFDALGECHTRVFTRDPMPLTHGKTAPAIFAAVTREFMTLRMMGHRGVCISKGWRPAAGPSIRHQVERSMLWFLWQ